MRFLSRGQYDLDKLFLINVQSNGLDRTHSRDLETKIRERALVRHELMTPGCGTRLAVRARPTL